MAKHQAIVKFISQTYSDGETEGFTVVDDVLVVYCRDGNVDRFSLMDWKQL